MTVDNCLKCASICEETILQHLVFRGYTIVEQLSTCQNTGTYIVRDNRESEGFYCLVRVLPLDNSDEPILELVQPTPNILAAAQLLGGFQVDSYSYLIRQYIPGQPLTWEIPNRVGWKEPQVIDLLRSILKILAQCHQAGAVHGNLHPNNLIRRPDGQLILTDFTGNQGYYHQTLRHHKVGLKSNILGLLEHSAYAAPEQWQGSHQPTSDIYALGMLGLQFLLGRQTWTSEEQLNQLLSTLPCQPLVSMLKRMVNRVPDQRYVNAQITLFALDNIQLSSQSRQAPVLVEQQKTEQQKTVIKESVAFPSIESATDLVCCNPMSAHPELMDTETLVLTSPISLQKVSVEDLAQPTILQLTNPSPVSATVKDATKTLLLAPELPKKPPGLSVSRVKWSPAVLALTAGVGGGVALYQNWSHPNQDTTPASSISSTSGKPVHSNQDAIPIPVPEASTDFDVGPNFSRTQIDHYFTQAYYHAKARNFSKALTYLEQVPQQNERYLEAQAKIAEYSKKREIKAQVILNEAYKWAAVANFEQALIYLHQIPTHTKVHRTALEKISEYRKKQELQAANLLILG